MPIMLTPVKLKLETFTDSASCASILAYTCFLDELAPHRNLRLDERRELPGCIGDDRHAYGEQALPDLGPVERAGDFLMQPVDDSGRRSCRRKIAERGGRRETRQA